ncbi:MAG TPA: hypothetical protein VLB45_06350 [Nitrosopumilaceae archaeon]|nr:hypothetical protein [Nitrosopumilaceae archaeon]
MKTLTLVLLALVGSMIIIPIQVYADSQLDSLLKIANQARDNIKIRLSQLTTVPGEIAKLYEQGSAETDALAKSVLQADIVASKQHFLSAMKLFKEASDKISSSSPEVVGEPLPATDASRLKNTIIRIEKSAEKLKAVATRNNIQINFTEFDNLIQIAKQNLDANNVDEVDKTLKAANQFILDVHNSISAAAKQKTSDRAKDFATKQINRINAIIKQLEIKLDNLDKESQNDDSRIKTKAARDMIVELKQLVLDGKLEEALQKIKPINEIIASIRISTTDDTSNTTETENANKVAKVDPTLERVKAKIQTQEEQLNTLSESASDNDIATKWITRALSLLENAKLQLDKSPEKAMNTLNEIDKIIRMVQRLTA